MYIHTNKVGPTLTHCLGDRKGVQHVETHASRVHWRRQLWAILARAPLDFRLIFLVTSEQHILWHSTPRGFLCSKNIRTHTFVAVYCMNFINHNIFVCHP